VRAQVRTGGAPSAASSGQVFASHRVRCMSKYFEASIVIGGRAGSGSSTSELGIIPFPCFSPRAHDTHNRRLLNTFIYFAFAMTDVASRTTDPRSSIDRWEVEELVSEVITRLYSAPDRGPASSARLPPCLTSALIQGRRGREHEGREIQHKIAQPSRRRGERARRRATPRRPRLPRDRLPSQLGRTQPRVVPGGRPPAARTFAPAT